MKMDCSLYVITDRRLARGRSLLEVARSAIRGGATVVQLRDKEATTRELMETGQRLRALTRQMGATFIVNDRADVALAVEADGVHLGVDDLPVPVARRLMGPEAIIGFSPETVEEARQAEADGADYLGVGAVFGTGIKPDAGSPIGLEGLGEIVRAVSIPVVAIGGITAANAARCIRAGAAGVAVIGAVVAADDIEAAARRLREQIEEARGS
jgi:thiamine-phosphate pyrophosphorylase